MLSKVAQHRVLIVTDNLHEAGHVANALDAQGYTISYSEFNGVTLTPLPDAAPEAILFVFTDYIEEAPNLINQLKSQFAPSTPTIIGALMRDGNIDLSIFDSVIFPPAHTIQIATRVNSLIRLGQMEREIKRRIITLKRDFNIDYNLSKTNLNQPFRILFIGKATPDFMVIINALQKKNVEVVAAFTSFSAFDYLHESDFDAVVMNALEQSEPALTISETMRRNAKLYHVPSLFLVNGDTYSDYELAYNKGARDIISADSDTKEISGRILELANYHRIHSQLKAEFEIVDAKCIDEDAKVFNEAFLRAHIDRTADELESNNLPLTLLTIQAQPNSRSQVPNDKIADAIGKLGQMIKSIVRMQDISARISEDIFIIAFPEQDMSSVESVLDRIKGIVDYATFDSGNQSDAPFTISLKTSISQHMDHESGNDLIDNALIELTGQEAHQLKAS